MEKQKNGKEGIIGHHHMYEYSHHGSSRRRKKRERRREIGEESLFKEIIVENFQILGDILKSKYRKFKKHQLRWIQRRLPPRYIIIKILKIKDKENYVKAAKEKQLITYKETRPPPPKKKSIGFLSRNLAGEDRLGWNTESGQRKQKSAMCIILCKTGA